MSFQLVIAEKPSVARSIAGIIQTEIGLVFKEVLLDAGVYKCTEEGRKAFQKFVDTVNA